MPTALPRHRRFAPFLLLMPVLQVWAFLNHLPVPARPSPASIPVSPDGNDLSKIERLNHPIYHPKLPQTSHYLYEKQKELTLIINQDFHHYFYFVDKTTSKVPPASLMDVPAKPWSPKEKADILALFKGIMQRSPGLIVNASSNTKIALYRTNKLNSAIATANPGIIIFEDEFFFRSNQYHIFSHELIHLCDLSSLLSASKEWRSILEPSVTKAQKENQPSQEEINKLGYSPALDWHLNHLASKTTQKKYQLQSGHACCNLEEALAENCARYLTTGTILQGSDKFRHLVARDILNPNSSAVTFRNHYTKATLAAVQLNLERYDREMQAALLALPNDKKEAIIPKHENRRLHILQSLANKDIGRQAIDTLLAERKYGPALEKINSAIKRYETGHLALTPELAANLFLEASQYYETLHRYKDSALAYENGTQRILASNDTFTTVTGTIDSSIENSYLEQLSQKIDSNPDEADTYIARGKTLWHLAEIEKTAVKKSELEDKAFADFNRSLILAEQSQTKNIPTQQLWVNCAQYQLRRDNWQAAIDCCQKAGKAGNTSPDALLVKIEALEKMKDYKEARLALGQFLEYCDRRKAKTQESN